MDSDELSAPICALNFTFVGLSGQETVVIHLPDTSGASLALSANRPAIELGVGYGDAAFSVSELVLQPRRLFFTVAGAPARLPVVLRVRAPGPFLFGSLQVGQNVETVVSTAAERLRILGPGFWAVPVPVSERAEAAPVAVAATRSGAAPAVAPTRARTASRAPVRSPPSARSAASAPAKTSTDTKAK